MIDGTTIDILKEAFQSQITLLKKGSQDVLRGGMRIVDSTNSVEEEAMKGVGREIDLLKEIKGSEIGKGRT